jgi:seryl-tRNA synthetase
MLCPSLVLSSRRLTGSWPSPFTGAPPSAEPLSKNNTDPDIASKLYALVLRKVGEIKSKTGKDHIEIGKELDLIDIEAAAEASGSRFCYLKNEAVLLEWALISFAFELLVKEDFTPILPPQMLKNEVARETGYYEGGEDDSFHLKDVDSVMIGTSEHSILAYHKNHIFQEKELC